MPGKILKRMRRTVAVAESCTAGLLGVRLTETPGSSDFFLGGVIAYSDRVKTRILKVPAPVLKRHGAVSAETAVLMARNVRKFFRADYGLAVTGIAGPGGGTRKKPVGLVYAAAASKNRTLYGKFRYKGARAAVRSQAARGALRLLSRLLAGESR